MIEFQDSMPNLIKLDTKPKIIRHSISLTLNQMQNYSNTGKISCCQGTWTRTETD